MIDHYTAQKRIAEIKSSYSLMAKDLDLGVKALDLHLAPLVETLPVSDPLCQLATRARQSSREFLDAGPGLGISALGEAILLSSAICKELREI